ncbi:uncharacterized protein [Dermacentor andersoni]|uniref:uncharacterized protein isoform X2 n=1 Tax=Dermacentor andersoni TaxID=34620 RepID=UPI00241810EA|nr:uncharacterized protein LOC129380435 isoform X2 [Dermacentor andersoni]
MTKTFYWVWQAARSSKPSESCFIQRNGTETGCTSACKCVTKNFKSTSQIGSGMCKNKRGYQFGRGAQCGGECYIDSNGKDTGCTRKCKCVKNNFRSSSVGGSGTCKRVYG